MAKSTVEREPLPSSAVTETEYYTDEPGWISNQNELLSGMKSFYQQTGVQPYLYIADTVNGSRSPSTQELQQYAQELYDPSLYRRGAFPAGFLGQRYGKLSLRIHSGGPAKTVMDRRAVGILSDYLDRYYTDTSMGDEEFFSTVFAKTAERIMSVTRSPWPTVLIVVVVAAAVVLECCSAI